MTLPDDDAGEAPIPSRLGQRMRQPASLLAQFAPSLLIAALFSIGLIWCLVSELRFQARATAGAEANLIHYATIGSGPTSHQIPVYAFRTADRQEVMRPHLRDTVLRNPHGERRRFMIRFDPARPREAQVDSVLARWGDTLLLLLVTLAPIAFQCTVFDGEVRMAWRAFRLSWSGVIVEAGIGRVAWVALPLSRGRVHWRWVIETRGVLPETGDGFDCSSDPLREDPRPFIGGRETLPVLVDPRRPDRALLVAEFLPLLPDFGLRRRAVAVWNERQKALAQPPGA